MSEENETEARFIRIYTSVIPGSFIDTIIQQSNDPDFKPPRKWWQFWKKG